MTAASRLLPAPRSGPRLTLRLYVAGRLANSVRASGNIRQLCERCVPRRFELEIVDVLQEPLRALADEVLVTPTLLRLAPTPRVQVVGDLSDAAVVLAALGIDTPPDV